MSYHVPLLALWVLLVAYVVGAQNYDEYLAGNGIDVPEVCLLPPIAGPCRAAFPMYYFNPTSGDCEFFKYGGCRGNRNRFKTIQDCYRKCAPGKLAEENLNGGDLKELWIKK